MFCSLPLLGHLHYNTAAVDAACYPCCRVSGHQLSAVIPVVVGFVSCLRTRAVRGNLKCSTLPMSVVKVFRFFF